MRNGFKLKSAAPASSSYSNGKKKTRQPTLKAQLAESQKRVEVLARANAALAKTVSRLADQPDIRHFAGQALEVFAQEFNAVGAEFWRRVNPRADELAIAMSFERGTGVVLGAEDDWNRMNEQYKSLDLDGPDATGDKAKWRAMYDGVICYMRAEEIYSSKAFEPFRERLAAQSIRTILSVPLFLKDTCLGTVCLRLDHDRTLNQPEEELAFALAKQLVLAIQLAFLAEESKQAALDRNRGVELAKANEVLRETLGSLSEQPELDAFCGQVLAAINRHLEAPGCTLWLRNAALNTHELVLFCEKSIPHKEPPAFGPHQVKRSFPLTQPQEETNYHRKPNFYPDACHYPTTDKDSCAWMLHYGARSLLTVPLVIGHQPIGSIAIHKPDLEPFPPEKVELAMALAEQAGLAIHITRLAEEARQAAVSREQQLAAQAQTAELTKANEIMRSTVEVMTSIPELDAFIGKVMVAINESLDAPGGTLWLLDHQRETSRLAMTVLDGQSYLQPPGKPGRVLATEFPFDETTFEIFIQNRSPRFTPNLRQHPQVDPGTRNWLEDLGVVGIQELPIVVGNRVIGVLDIHRPDNEPFPDKKLQLALALTQQVGLAIHITRLAEEAKQTAIAREQEQAAKEKVAELVKANEALRRSVDSLIDLDSINEFLGISLRTIADVLGVPSACFWKHRDGFSHLELVYENGQVIPGGESNHPNALSPTPHDAYTDYVGGKLRTEPHTVHTDDMDVPFTPEQRKMLKELGVRALIGIPIILDETAVARITARLTHDMPDPTSSRIELIRALANQAALALQVSRLAEEAKQAAIARAQEQAAREKVAELVKANEALRRSVDSLIDLESINDFLGISLRTIADVLNVPSACFWKNQNGFSHLELVYENGQVIPGKESNHPNAFSPNPLNHQLDLDSKGELRSDPFFNLIDDPEVPFTDAQRTMLRDLGVRALLSIPIVLGETVVARITARLTHDMPDPTPSRIELIRALANQAALALQVSRLAEEAKQTAVLGERARIAGEIHDSLAQSFAGISLHLEAAFAARRKGKKENESFLENARRMAAFGLAEARSSVLTLKPNVLDQGDLSEMLRQLAQRSSVKGHLQCEFIEYGEPVALGKDMKHAAFRVVQEALSNALKHAQPKKIRFTLHYADDHFSVSIQDDGIGFTATEIKQGLGLRGMQERCEEQGGCFKLVSEPGKGTTLTVTFPIIAK